MKTGDTVEFVERYVIRIGHPDEFTCEIGDRGVIVEPPAEFSGLVGVMVRGERRVNCFPRRVKLCAAPPPPPPWHPGARKLSTGKEPDIAIKLLTGRKRLLSIGTGGVSSQ